MNRKILIGGLTILIIALSSPRALSQNTYLHSSSFNAGFATAVSPIAAVRSVVGQSFVGTSFDASSVIESGFLADTLLRDIVLSVQTLPEELPARYALRQNYPNPFNPVTVIQYSLSGRSRVTLRVYNVLGEEIKLLVNDETQDAGFRQVQWDGSNLPSGVYFYRLTATPAAENQTAFISTMKMMLIR
jgi:hypothetical protein